MSYTIIKQTKAATRGSDEYTYYKVAATSERNVIFKLPKDSSQSTIDAEMDILLAREAEEKIKEDKIKAAVEKAEAEALLPDEAKE